MMELLGIVPWELVVYAVGEYWAGKTDMFEANSFGELAQNVLCKLFKKNTKL